MNIALWNDFTQLEQEFDQVLLTKKLEKLNTEQLNELVIASWLLQNEIQTILGKLVVSNQYGVTNYAVVVWRMSNAVKLLSEIANADDLELLDHTDGFRMDGLMDYFIFLGSFIRVVPSDIVEKINFGKLKYFIF